MRPAAGRHPVSIQRCRAQAFALPMKTLLIVYHSVTGGTQQMAEAAAAGASTETSLQVKVLRAPDAGVRDVLQADGYIFATPENLAAMSGLMKDFFDRTYILTIASSTDQDSVGAAVDLIQGSVVMIDDRGRRSRRAGEHHTQRSISSRYDGSKPHQHRQCELTMRGRTIGYPCSVDGASGQSARCMGYALSRSNPNRTGRRETGWSN